jgi:hypothetical protein
VGRRVDQEKIDDPTDVKPADWDSVPKQIADPDAEKPDDWVRVCAPYPPTACATCHLPLQVKSSGADVTWCGVVLWYVLG